VKELIVAHEHGHRLTLQHLGYEYLLDSTNIGPLGAVNSTNKRIMLSYDEYSHPPRAQIKIRVQLQKRQDFGHAGEGYSTELMVSDQLEFEPDITGTT